MSTSRSNLTRNKIGRRLWVPVTFFALLVAFVFVRTPSFYDKYFGVPEKEANAVFSLQRIHKLENVYATAHPDLGYACQLKQLQPTENTPDGYATVDPAGASVAIAMNFRAGEWAGYKFEIVGCAPEKNGVFAHYQVTAVPLKPGLSGVRAFCTNESGSVFYDPNGSSTECMAARRLLP